jgi:hypothetical protein
MDKFCCILALPNALITNQVNSTKGLIGIFLMVFAMSCKKEDPSAIDLGYDYFPNKVGSYVIFAVDSTAYNGEELLFTYQLKEVITEEFVDNIGEPASRVECYIRHFNSQPWILRSVCVQKRGSTNAERVLNNQRTIILEFPIAEGGTWNGNIYNNRGPVSFKYQSVAQPVDIGIQEFANTVTVLQENVNNLVEQNISKEVYALHVGNVYRYQKRTETQNNVTTGYEVEYAAISYGFE